MHPTTKPSARTEKQVALLRAHALGYPETREDFPWGHSAFKVRDKAFAFLHADAEGFSISVKLPDSNALALQLPFAEPTGYGLGKSGWVSARFKASEAAPLSMLKSWLEESYTALAPKRLVQALLSPSPPAKAGKVGKPAGKPAAKKGPARKGPAKKTPVKKRGSVRKKATAS